MTFYKKKLVPKYLFSHVLLCHYDSQHKSWENNNIFMQLRRNVFTNKYKVPP